MSLVRRSAARLLSMFRHSALEREFDDEITSHIALATEDYLRHGMPLDEAQRLARSTFGGRQASKDIHRDTRGLPWLETAFYDLRISLRGLRRDRAFALTAIATLALAIALNVTVFTIMDAMLFRGYPLVQRNDRLLYIQERSPSGVCCVSYSDFENWRTATQVFEGMAYIASNRGITFRDRDGRSIDKLTFRISANTFGLLGVAPMLGRDFVAADELPGAPQVVILNHRFWESRFAKRNDVVNSTVQVNGAPATIIGVMPRGFDFPTREDMWMPVARGAELLQRGITPGGFMVVGRLRDHATLADARAELETINRRLETEYPSANRGVVPTVATHSEAMSGGDARLIWGSLWVGAWFVFLIACANLTNLTMVRTIGRWREFATRLALGAGQWRMIRQIVIEALALASVGGLVGWWITNWSVRRWEGTTASRYQILDYTVDARTLSYLVAIALVAALLMSVGPVIRILQVGAGQALKGDARGVTASLRGKRLAAGLLAGQMALAIVLLSGAGVLVRSFVEIVRAETGVGDADRILVGSMQLPSETYPIPDARSRYFRQLTWRLHMIPGIDMVTIASTIPVKFAPLRTFEIEGQRSSPGDERAIGVVRAGSDYFRVVGVPAINGRVFNDADHASALPVAVVNERFAADYWPDEPAIGKRLRWTNRNAYGEWRTIVGVVPNILQGDPLRQEFKPLVYIPFEQEPATRVAFFLVRTAVPDQVAATIRTNVQQLDPDVLLEDFGTLKASFAFDRDFMDAQHSELGKYAKVAPAFALIALLLSATGLTAVIAHSVSQRTKEIGVRMAIGAAAADIRRLVVREGLSPVVVGMIVGLAASLGINRLLQSQLVGVSPYDPATMTGAPVMLMLAALLACRIPARRAMAVEPVVALKHE